MHLLDSRDRLTRMTPEPSDGRAQVGDGNDTLDGTNGSDVISGGDAPLSQVTKSCPLGSPGYWEVKGTSR